jgi:hypothetical protein
MTREDLHDLVTSTPREQLVKLAEALAGAHAEVIARLSAPVQTSAQETSLVPLTKEWARAHGYQLETARKLARTGRLEGAVPAPSSGRGRRRRWLVPATLRGGAEARPW